ncbi:MAG: rhomboid family intramembrane serine protease, partial [Pseudomonadota bacterium]
GFERLLGIELSQFGLRPREPIGLLGLLTTPLLHGNFNHLLSNTIPLFVGGVALLFLYPSAALRAVPAIYLGSSALAWLFARPSLHIGASGLVYGLLAFVFVSGILRRDLRSVGVSLMIWLLYGSMIWGVIPSGQGTSWELHFSGAAIGVVMAYWLKQFDRPPLKRYDWEDEDDDDGPGPRRWDEFEEHHLNADDDPEVDDQRRSEQPWRD